MWIWSLCVGKNTSEVRMQCTVLICRCGKCDQDSNPGLADLKSRWKLGSKRKEVHLFVDNTHASLKD